jgi:hypothetical protein
MPRVELATLPDDARVWVFSADRRLAAHECARLLEAVDGFLDRWNAHGSPLTCARDWRYQQFLVVAVDERTAPPSGCSIDALVHALRALETELGLSLLDHGRVWFREGGEVRCVDRAAFRTLAREGAVGPDTVVFDNTLTRLAQLSDAWERAARESWHRRVYFPMEV